MAELKEDSIHKPVRKLHSKRVRIVTPKSVVSIQLELIARTLSKGVRPRFVVISKLDVTTNEPIDSCEFSPTDTKPMEKYLKKIGATTQIKRCMTWVNNKLK